METTKASDHWIQTFTGRAVAPLDPDLDPSSLVIEDIAHSLSLVNRFTGHTTRAWSVAAHSMAVVECLRLWGCGTRQLLHGLIHDGSEAYLCDIAAPLKSHRIFDGYRAAEEILQAKVEGALLPFSASMLTANEAKHVKHADLEVCFAERLRFLPEGAWQLSAPVNRAAIEAVGKIDRAFAFASPEVIERGFHQMLTDLLSKVTP